MNIRKFRNLAMLSLPLAALALAAVLLSMNLGVTNHAKAAAGTPELSLHIGSASTGSPTADSKGATDLIVNSPTNVSVALDAIAGNYDAVSVSIRYSGAIHGKFEDGNNKTTGSTSAWPDCTGGFPVEATAIQYENASCSVGTSNTTGSSFLGTIATFQVTCNSLGAGEVHLDNAADGSESGIIPHGLSTQVVDDGPDMININCVNPPTAVPATPTSTPPPIPRVFKTCTSLNTTGPGTLCNVFLTRQGAKVPPTTCAAGNNAAILTEQINIPISTVNSKGEDQTLGAYEFEVRYDSKNVCVFLTPSAAWQAGITAGTALCTIRDDSNSTLKGIAQIGCVSIGKGHKPAGLILATITVKPQPELYSQIRPNQDNGIAVQLLNQGCNLADEQGHAIPVFSCEDADLTFRFLEGDVDGPDCDVDVFDTQQVAFRWGVQKGSLLYNSFMDLSPSGQVKGDGRIDIKDVQFVFGRIGSTCVAPWPAQLPVNPKA